MRRKLTPTGKEFPPILLRPGPSLPKGKLDAKREAEDSVIALAHFHRGVELLCEHYSISKERPPEFRREELLFKLLVDLFPYFGMYRHNQGRRRIWGPWEKVEIWLAVKSMKIADGRRSIANICEELAAGRYKGLGQRGADPEPDSLITRYKESQKFVRENYAQFDPYIRKMIDRVLQAREVVQKSLPP